MRGEEEPRPDAEFVVSARSGSVLLKQTILKADHFPGCQNKKLYPNIDGAPNFRQVEGLPVYGVAVPTVIGLRIVLDIVGADQGKRKVLWHNMREEPLLYINGKPYVVRDAVKPFANLEYTGIDRIHVEEMEQRLKQDVLQEAEAYGGCILLAGESDDYEVIEYWENVEPCSVRTPQEVFTQMIGVGYDVDYLRVPVTDEKAPKESDCEQLIERCWDPPAGAALIFNCQMGRGRTTTGMIIASLLQLRHMGAFPSKTSTSEDTIPAWFKLTRDEPQDGSSDSELLKSGMYAVVRSLLRMLSRGRKGKQILDLVIDACSAMQNLREAIVIYRDRMSTEGSERKRSDLLRVCLEYLERYCVLIALTSYLSHPRFHPGSPNFLGFQDFMKMRREFKSVLERLLRRNPLSALQLKQNSSVDVKEKDGAGGNGYSGVYIDKDPINQIIAGRSGNVLLQYTILKEDHFPYIQKEGIPQPIQGAPNFRQAPGFPVCGVALPTVEGIKRILCLVKAGPDHPHPVTAVWHNMREEPVVYINGRPFVLREEARPFKNLREYAGIDPYRLEKMESRLKGDILQEAKAHHGKILVCKEIPQDTFTGHLEYVWETIENDCNVLTPAEVYDSFRKEGYLVNYHRLPVTEGTPPAIRDFDILVGNIRHAKPDSPLIFNCHNGIGRSTIGMVVGLLFRLNVQQSSLWETVSNYSQTLDGSVTGTIRRATSEESDFDAPNATGLELDTDVVDQTEHAAGEEGTYLAVRRLILLLDSGPDSKQAVDRVIDACDLLINLRTSIMRFRKPFRAHSRPETQNRNTFFKWSVAYLERYCRLIAFSSYLDHTGSGDTATFAEWIAERAEVSHALGWIRNNPAASLSIVDISPSKRLSEPGEEQEIMDVEEQKVLADRKGSVLTKRTILKSYHIPGYIMRASSSVMGLPATHTVEDLPIFSVGNLSIEGIRRLLLHLDAGPEGNTHVKIIDHREELLVYIAGAPYLRRDLNSPVASLKHTGVAAGQLHQLEESLRDDVRVEAKRCGQGDVGRILVHKEVEHHDSHKSKWARTHGKDVTAPSEDPVATVKGIWKETIIGCDIREGICTPLDISEGFAASGFKLSYSRVPLAREQVPHTRDLDLIKNYMEAGSEASTVKYLILSRTPHGSSARFVAAFIASYLLQNAQGKKPQPSNSLDVDLYSRDSKDHLAFGEFDGILNLCRVLPRGIEHKHAVDQAIDRCHRIGSLREDILSCKYSDPSLEEGKTAKLFGLHYLQRYFFLIAFQCYSESPESKSECFSDWVSKRKELLHLLKTLTL